jgi:hypothetical protein
MGGELARTNRIASLDKRGGNAGGNDYDDGEGDKDDEERDEERDEGDDGGDSEIAVEGKPWAARRIQALGRIFSSEEEVEVDSQSRRRENAMRRKGSMEEIDRGNRWLEKTAACLR